MRGGRHDDEEDAEGTIRSSPGDKFQKIPHSFTGHVDSGGWLQAQETLGKPPGSALLQRAARWRAGLEQAGWPRPPGQGPILPLLVGDNARALALQGRLEQAGLLSVAIRPPTVPEGTARLRLVLRADLPAGTLARLVRELGSP